MTRPLLSRELGRELDKLRRLLESRARSGAAGDRRGSKRGGTAEFSEHRGYTAGDDVRHVDWLAYARTGQPRIKLYREDEDSILRLVIDASASMAYGSPSKLDFARRIAAALAYLSLSGTERAEVLVLSGDDDHGPGAIETLGPRRGRASLGPVLRELGRIEPRGRATVPDAIVRITRRAARPGLLLVVSDFLDPASLEGPLGLATAAGHEVGAIHVLCREEVEPALEGDVTLVDAETGDELALTADAPALLAYERRVAEHASSLARALRNRRGLYVRALSDEPILPVVRRILARTSARPEVDSAR